jgi:7,8-dihydroneopterin aldolase/epimerase/oxygenase
MNDKAEDGRVLSMPMTRAAAVSALDETAAQTGIRRVFVRDLVLLCLIGVHDHEKDSPQRVRINLDLAVVEDGQPIEDKLANVVCYEEIVTQVRDIVSRRHVKLVETLAEDVVAACFTDASVQSARVRIEKLDVFADTASVGIEIERLNSEV